MFSQTGVYIIIKVGNWANGAKFYSAQSFGDKVAINKYCKQQKKLVSVWNVVWQKLHTTAILKPNLEKLIFC